MSIFSIFKSFDGPDQGRINSLKQNVNQSRGKVNDIVSGLLQRGRGLANQPTLTAEDLFGSEITRLSDNARASANQTKRALSRSLLAGGGDNSSAITVNMLRADQELNQTLGDITNRFNSLAANISRARQERGLSAIGQALSGRQNARRTTAAQLSNLLTRKAQQQAAEKQRSSSFWGTILGVGGTIAGALLCWSAEELYPDRPSKVAAIRTEIKRHLDDGDDLGEFARQYSMKGDQWAQMIQENPEMRRATDRLLTQIHGLHNDRQR